VPSAATFKFSPVIVVIHQAKPDSLGSKRGDEQAEQEKSKEEGEIFCCFFVHGVGCAV